MKIIKFILLSGFLLITSVNAQDSGKIDMTKSTINKLFELCKANDFEKAAELMAYSGNDKERDLNSPYNFKTPSEANTVKRISKKIKAFLDISDKNEFGKFEEKIDGNSKSYHLDVVFLSGSQKLKTVFSFVEVKGKMLLADLH